MGEEQQYKVLYSAPLKALGSERFEDWKNRFPDKKIVMLTGDTLFSEKARKKQMQEALDADIIIATSELIDSITRRVEKEIYAWLKLVGMLVVDESHILTVPERGHAVETGIMRFSKINPTARIVLLSATQPNCDELAKWLTGLNGKKSKVIFSNWRPVELQFNYLEYPVTGYYNADQSSKIELAVKTVMSKPKEKFLVFTWDKTTGRKVVQALAREGQKAVFHNADLEFEDRKDIETQFRDKSEDSLRVLVSTTTTAWGLNLPARNVVIVGVHRGLSEVDSIDVIQASGRAGRYGIDDAGFVHMVIPERTTESWKYTFANPRPVRSVLKDHRILAFHMLAEMDTRQIASVNDAKAWYRRSLASFQNQDFTDEDIEALLKDLEDMQMIVRKGPWITITGLGKVSAWLYYSPYSVYSWYRNFQKSFEIGMDDLLLAYSIADIPSNDWSYIPKECKDEVATFDWQLRNRGIMPTMASPFSVAAYKCLTGDTENKSFTIQTRAIKYDIRRMVQAISLIDSMWAKWEKKELWSVLPARIMYGVPEEVVHLTKLTGIGGKRAMKLWNEGFRNFSDIADSGNRGKLMKMFAPKIVMKISEEAKILEEKEDVA